MQRDTLRGLGLAGLLACASVLPALASEPLSPEAFDAFTQGRTLTYFSFGEPYGAERYMPGRRVLWTFLDGECQYGEWYPQGPYICFDYGTDHGPQCWQFFLEGDQLRAVFEDGSADTSPYVADDMTEEMLCYGPDVGV